jgi:pimeloyl-ACP methyl ester carboxylesterase
MESNPCSTTKEPHDVVLSHGHRSTEPCGAGRRRSAAGWRLIVLDLRGYGETTVAGRPRWTFRSRPGALSIDRHPARRHRRVSAGGRSH